MRRSRSWRRSPRRPPRRRRRPSRAPAPRSPSSNSPSALTGSSRGSARHCSSSTSRCRRPGPTAVITRQGWWPPSVVCGAVFGGRSSAGADLGFGRRRTRCVAGGNVAGLSATRTMSGVWSSVRAVTEGPYALTGGRPLLHGPSPIGLIVRCHNDDGHNRSEDGSGWVLSRAHGLGLEEGDTAVGAEVKVEHLTKRFGKATIWEDVSLTIPPGEISVMLGPSGTGKSVLLKHLVGLLRPDQRSHLDPRQGRLHGPRVRALRDPQAVRRPLPGRRAVRLAEPLRQHRLPAARAHEEVRVRDQADRAREARHRRSGRHRGQAPRRDLRRYEEARRPRPRARAQPRDPAVRRARLRSRPGPRRLPRPAGRRPQRADRRDLSDRDAQHRHRPHGAGQHRPALPEAPGDVRSAPASC